ncbi:helicase HerA domain-containing protein [Thermocatellispora tengchongensis]
MPALLSAGLAARIVELGEGGRAFGQDPPPSAKPVLHARLRRNLDDVTEDAAHWAFRAIAAEHPIAALTRLRKACVAAGLTSDAPKRRLFILRNDEWSGGKRTREAVTAFEQAGGRRLSVDEADLRILAALRDLLAEDPPNLQAWLVDRRPTQDVKVLAEALGDVWSDPEPRVPAPEPRPEAPVADGVPSLVVGRAVEGGDAPVRVALEALRRHTAIFAGSGSGKTVLIRRLVEECALQGVSAIVLDPNNDLARLGEAWPEPPAYWEEGDAERAARYLEGTDVVIWTPGRAAGRPLTFQPLPDFAGVAGDPDEYAEAVESAVAAIVPRVKLDARTTRAQLGQAVLRETVRHYGRRPGTATLKGLADLLAELPEGVSELGNAQRIAADLAEALRAAMVNDPLFGGQGTPVDPGVLLTPPPGKRARISVISLVGLPGDEQRQGFVNRLQMALFAWIKRNPAGERPLGGLFVMDEAQTFAPSGSMTACTRSTLALASQARKYGLGLVFATQAPKGLHNRIPGNAATQFFGMLNSPIQIEAAKEMARAKGSGVGDIAQLRTGQFYAAVEGAPFVKVRAPMCLSRHPRSPLASEEVIARAARNAG